jgi:diguanylate cyclase (GGDEF)-like protein
MIVESREPCKVIFKNEQELNSSFMQNALIHDGETVYFAVSTEGDFMSNPFECVAGSASALGISHSPLSFSYLLSNSNNYLASPAFYGKKDITKDLHNLFLGIKNVLCFEFPISIAGKHLLFAVSIFMDKEKKALVVVMRRLRKIEIAVEDFYLRAQRDFTTGLLNKASCLDAITTTKLDGKSIVLFTDLNNFKLVNDIYGHTVGDSILKRFSDALTNNAPENFTAYRYGGDEFVVIAHDATKEEVASFLKNVEDDFSDCAPQNIVMSFSAGAVLSYPSLKNPLFLIRCSDKAMYLAKREKTPYYYLNEKEVAAIVDEESTNGD